MNTTLKTVLTAGIVVAAVILAPVQASAKGPSKRGHDEAHGRDHSRTYDRGHREAHDRGHSRTYDRGHTQPTRGHSQPTRGHTSNHGHDRSRFSTGWGHGRPTLSIGFSHRPIVTTSCVVRTERVLVEPGHYELRTEKVLVEEAHWEEKLIPETREVIRDDRGRVIRIIIEPERTEQPLYTRRRRPGKSISLSSWWSVGRMFPPKRTWAIHRPSLPLGMVNSGRYVVWPSWEPISTIGIPTVRRLGQY